MSELKNVEVVPTQAPTEVLFVQKDIFQKNVLWDSVNLLQKTLLFDDWSRTRLLALARELKTCTHRPNSLIIQQGSVPDGVYFVKDGTVVVQKEVKVVQRNRWPVEGKKSWEVKESVHPR